MAAVTITATVGSASANSFVTEAEAATYFAGRLNASAYTDEPDPDIQRRALVEATRELTVRLWQGTRVDTTQALNWPRLFCPNPDIPWVGTYYFPSTTIPQRVKNATCELALEFLKAGTTDIAALDPTIDIKRKRVDVLETEYVERGQRAKGLRRFPRVWNEISLLLADTGSTVALVRG